MDYLNSLGFASLDGSMQSPTPAQYYMTSRIAVTHGCMYPYFHCKPRRINSICAKTNVASLKPITNSRFEVTFAWISKLMKHVKNYSDGFILLSTTDFSNVSMLKSTINMENICSKPGFVDSSAPFNSKMILRTSESKTRRTAHRTV